MSRRPARFTQADIARAIRAVKKERAHMAVEVATDGTIRVVPIDHKPEDDEKARISRGREIVL